MGQVEGALRRAAVLMDWTRMLAEAGLEAPGYKEASEAAAAAWELKQQQKMCLKPRGRGKRGRGQYPSLKETVVD